MKKLFKLSTLEKVDLEKPRRCLYCNSKIISGLKTEPYSNGHKWCVSIFCNEDCFLNYDDEYWQGIANEKNGEFEILIN